MGKNVFAGVGMAKGDKKDSAQVGADAVKIAVENMKKQGGKTPDFGILYCSTIYDLKKLVSKADETFKDYNEDVQWIGGTSYGEISSYGYTQDSCVAMAVQSDHIHIGIGVGEKAFKDPIKAGEMAAAKSLESIKSDKVVDPYVRYLAMKKKSHRELVKMTPYTSILISPGVTMNRCVRGDDYLKGIENILGRNVSVVGGATSSKHFRNDFQFYNGNISSNNLILMTGVFNTETKINVKHGLKPTDKTLNITDVKEDGYIVTKIDGKPANKTISNILKDVRGWSASKSSIGMSLFNVVIPVFEKAGLKITEDVYKGILSHPFGLPDPKGNFWIRVLHTPVSGGGVRFVGRIPKNSSIKVMKIDNKDLRESEIEVFKEIMKELKEPSFILNFDCVGRAILSNKIEAIESEKKKIIGDIPMIGFFTSSEYGYIGNSPNMNFNLSNVAFGVGNNLISEKRGG